MLTSTLTLNTVWSDGRKGIKELQNNEKSLILNTFQNLQV